MKKIFNFWMILIVLIYGVFQVPNFNLILQQSQISTQDTTGITEENFF